MNVFDALEWLAVMTSHMPNRGEQACAMMASITGIPIGFGRKNIDKPIPSLVDLLVLGKETLNALVAKGIEHSYKEGTALLGCMLPKTHPCYRDLGRYGFLPSMKTFLLMVYPHVEEKGLLGPEAWYVKWGDRDAI